MNVNANPQMNGGMMMNGMGNNMGQMANNQQLQPNHMQQNQQRQVRTRAFSLVERQSALNGELICSFQMVMNQGNYRPTQVSQSQMMSQHGQSGPILMNTSDQNQMMSNPHQNPPNPMGGPVSDDNAINNYKQIIDKL